MAASIAAMIVRAQELTNLIYYYYIKQNNCSDSELKLCWNCKLLSRCHALQREAIQYCVMPTIYGECDVAYEKDFERGSRIYLV